MPALTSLRDLLQRVQAGSRGFPGKRSKASQPRQPGLRRRNWAICWTRPRTIISGSFVLNWKTNS